MVVRFILISGDVNYKLYRRQARDSRQIGLGLSSQQATVLAGARWHIMLSRSRCTPSYFSPFPTAIYITFVACLRARGRAGSRASSARSAGATNGAPERRQRRGLGRRGSCVRRSPRAGGPPSPTDRAANIRITNATPTGAEQDESQEFTPYKLRQFARALGDVNE